MQSLPWMGWALTAGLVLGPPTGSGGVRVGTGTRPILEIASLDRADCSLLLSWPWGAMAVNRVMFDDHRGPFRAVVESSGDAVRVTFDGWGDRPFVASAARIRVIYRAAGREGIDFVAEVGPDGLPCVRTAGRAAVRGRRLVFPLGQAAGDASTGPGRRGRDGVPPDRPGRAAEAGGAGRPPA